MKKLISKINGREFYVGEDPSSSLDGIPCFSMKEVELMRGKTFSIHDLNIIFDTKLNTGATVETVRQQTGYTETKPPERSQLAKDYALKIKEFLKSKGARTEEEKNLIKK